MGLIGQLRLRLEDAGVLPASRLALITWYLLGLDVFLYALQKFFGWMGRPYGGSLSGWVIGLSIAVIALFVILALRWAKAKLLWRLRHRLIVTYVFIGVIPVILLAALGLLSLYLFAGQFATFVVTTNLQTEIKAIDAANSAIAHELAARLETEKSKGPITIASFRGNNEAPVRRQIFAWLDQKFVFPGKQAGGLDLPPPAHWATSFHGVVRENGQLYLRAAQTVPVKKQSLTVLSSEPLDKSLLQHLATNLGEVALYSSGPGTPPEPPNEPKPIATAGSAPPALHRFDMEVIFIASIAVSDWDTGNTAHHAAISVHTRLSKLYQRLFESLGDFAPLVELVLLVVAIVFAVIELIALIIGVRLTRSMTAAVGELYDATHHINRGEFNYRIPVTSTDQLATLANSFNSMTASLEKLMIDQKEKQRMENELVIAQEVQSQLFPRRISQLPTLEVFGYCRPARTVSGDYYDFMAMSADKLLLAVGDVSGKGISAALLMATIHSAVRAYSLEGIPALRESMAAGARHNPSIMSASGWQGAEVSPGALLGLLNRQLFDSTPAEKYATLFLSFYNGRDQNLTYSNGGHLPPLILCEDHAIQRLDQGGTVVGLLNDQGYDDASVQLHPGEIFLAYSDGVTEPENDFGEFGEQRLIDLVESNRKLPLAKISELVTAAVDDWIGAHEQPDDVTLVLARAR